MKKNMIYLTATLLTLVVAQGPEKNKKTGKDSTKTKKISLEKKIEKMDKFTGLFTFYQDTADGSVFIEIHKDQINKEYIYFGHAHDGIVDVGFNRGSYRSSKIFTQKF